MGFGLGDEKFCLRVGPELGSIGKIDVYTTLNGELRLFPVKDSIFKTPPLGRKRCTIDEWTLRSAQNRFELETIIQQRERTEFLDKFPPVPGKRCISTGTRVPAPPPTRNRKIEGPHCPCGYSEWTVAADGARCSHCGSFRAVSYTGYLLNGPSCDCGYNHWFTGSDGVRCSHCNDFIRLKYSDFLLNGPLCPCGYTQWFTGSDGARCSHCGKSRAVAYTGYLLNGPSCDCGYNQWFTGSDGVRCSHCGDFIRLNYQAFRLEGPHCSCGYNQWFIGNDCTRCSHCGRSRED